MFHLTCVQISFSSVWVAEWPPFGKKMLNRLTICILCILTICNFSYFPFSFLGLDLGSDCFSSRSLHTFYFLYITFILQSTEWAFSEVRTNVE